jgi:TolB-like protein
MPVDPPGGADFLTANTYAGDALSSMLLQRAGVDSGILATSLVRLDALEDTSAFGRLAGQQIASRIAQHGFMVLDVRLTNALTITREGEFMLSRDMGRLLAAEYNAHAVLVGTYANSGDKLFVSARILRLTDGTVLAAYEYYLPTGGDIAPLLDSGSGRGPSLEALWRKYTARGQAFAAPAREKSAPAAPKVEPPAAPKDGPPAAAIGRAAVPGGSSLPEQTPLLSGGRRIQP